MKTKKKVGAKENAGTKKKVGTKTPTRKALKKNSQKY